MKIKQTSTVHTFLNPKVSLALVNFFIRNVVKLSVIDTFESFNNFLLEKAFFLSLYQTNLIITGLSLPLFFWFPDSVCFVNIIIRNFYIYPSLTDLIAKRSVFLFLLSGRPCINRQFLLEYCSCLSVSAVISSTFPLK